MKKLVSMLLALVMLVGVFAVAAAAEESSPYKIAILTGTTSQGDEEYYAAEALKEAYPDIVLHDTYPDNFSSEVETTISKLLTFAEDPEVKAIIFVQGVQGATAAFNQIKEKRPDILLVCGVPAEDPVPIGAAAESAWPTTRSAAAIRLLTWPTSGAARSWFTTPSPVTWAMRPSRASALP